MTTELAQHVAPHLIGSADILHVADGGTVTDLPARGAPRGAGDEHLMFMATATSIDVTRSPSGPGTVAWADIVGIIRAGADDANVAVVRSAHTTHRAALIARHDHLAAHPWRPRDPNPDPAVTAEAERLQQAVTDAYHQLGATVDAVIEQAHRSGQLDLGLEEWLMEKAGQR